MFLKSTLAKLNDFSEGILVLGGDFNVPLDPILDSSTGHSSISQLHLRAIRRTLGEMDLADCWRTLNPSVKDFIYYSAIHD
ncbi:Hypothetical predicted protein, partial [Pelobates cultripes]